MPVIKTTSEHGVQLEKVLQDVLNTQPNKWNYFFYPHRIKEVFAKLADQIQKQNFFNSDYSINVFLDFLKTYVKAKFKNEELKTIDAGSLINFNQVCRALQSSIISHTTGLNESQQTIVSNYIGLLHQLMEVQHRSIFTKSEICLTSIDLQAIAGMLKNNSATIEGALIQKYIALLKISFDVPKLLAKYNNGLGLISLAEACFLNKKLDVHFVVTRFLSLLGYQGQLLDYYKNDPRFGIETSFLNNATEILPKEALELQKYFLANLNKRGDLNKELLQHYLLKQFYAVIYKKYPDRIEALKTDRRLAPYIKFDYVALPNTLICSSDLLSKIKVEFANLSRDKAQLACIAMQNAQLSYEQWKSSLKLNITSYASDYIFRSGDSYDSYFYTYAYGESPMAGGFYRSRSLKLNTVSGIGYSFFANDQQFIDVAAHEFIHHLNNKFFLEALSHNSDISAFLNRNFNEGLAVLFAKGACAPGYVDQDFKNITAPLLPTLLNSEYIGYTRSWLYNNYLIQYYPDFYRELLSLDKNEFKQRWTPILNTSQQHFLVWLSNLKESCKNAPKELSIENNPSIYIGPKQTTKMPIPTTLMRRNTEIVPAYLAAKKLTPDEMGRELIFTISRNEFDKFKSFLKLGANPNYIEDSKIGYSLLHYLYYYGNCDTRYLELLLDGGAEIIANKQGLFAIAMAEKSCNATQLQHIKQIFDRYSLTNLNITTSKPNETGPIAYQQKNFVITIFIPISAFVSGLMAGGWEAVAQRYQEQYLYLSNIIFFGLQPISSAMTSAVMNSLLAGPAVSLGLEDAWLSFACYLVMNYFGLTLAQLQEKASQKIQNKLLNLLIPILLYTFFLNPSLIITLISEGFGVLGFQTIMMPLLSMLSGGILFKTGEYAAQKTIGKFFPVNTADSINSNQKYFLRYSLDGTPKKVSADQNTLENIKENLEAFIIKMKKNIDNQAYKLSFAKHILSARNNISILLTESEDECNIFKNNYRKAFKEFEDSLVEIQKNLDLLGLEKSKIHLLWDKVTAILTCFRGIRPYPQVNSGNLISAHERSVTIEEEPSKTPLMVSFSNGVNNPYYDNKEPPPHKLPSKLGRISYIFKSKSIFPPPPTEQELQEMLGDQSHASHRFMNA